ALVIGLLDERDVRVYRNDLHPSADEILVVLRPLRERTGKRGRVVPDEPGRLELARSHPGPHRDLEGACTEANGRRFLAVSQVFVDQPIDTVTLPVEFLLQCDHLLSNRVPLTLAGFERVSDAVAEHDAADSQRWSRQEGA